MRHVILSALILSSLTSAITVVKATKSAMMIGLDKKKAFEMNEAVCAVRGDTKVACGRIGKITEKGAIVRLSVVKGQVEIGDEVIRLADRKTAAKAEMREAIRRENPVPKNSLGIGMIGGTGGGASYVFAILSYERALSKNFSLRIEPTYFVAPGDGFTLTALGAKVGASFDSVESFKGFWISVSGGYYSMVMTDSSGGAVTTAGVLVGTGLIGYRLKIGKTVGLSLGLGGQYLPLTAFSINPTPPSFLPVGTGSISLLF